MKRVTRLSFTLAIFFFAIIFSFKASSQENKVKNAEASAKNVFNKEIDIKSPKQLVGTVPPALKSQGKLSLSGLFNVLYLNRPPFPEDIKQPLRFVPNNDDDHFQYRFRVEVYDHGTDNLRKAYGFWDLAKENQLAAGGELQIPFANVDVYFITDYNIPTLQFRLDNVDDPKKRVISTFTTF